MACAIACTAGGLEFARHDHGSARDLPGGLSLVPAISFSVSPVNVGDCLRRCQRQDVTQRPVRIPSTSLARTVMVMVGHGTGNGRHALDHIEPTEVGGILAGSYDH